MWAQNLAQESLDKIDNAKEVILKHWRAHCGSGANEPYWLLATGRAFLEVKALMGNAFPLWCERLDRWDYSMIEPMMMIGSNPHYTLENIDTLFTFDTLYRTYYQLEDASRNYVISLASKGVPITENLMAIVEGKLMEGDRPRKEISSEVELEDTLCRYLRNRGAKYKRQVHCEVGRADVVTATAVYELKHTLNAENIFRAVGQVLIYRDCLNRKAKPILVATRLDGDDRVKNQVSIVRQMGIDVIIWDDFGEVSLKCFV